MTPKQLLRQAKRVAGVKRSDSQPVLAVINGSVPGVGSGKRHVLAWVGHKWVWLRSPYLERANRRKISRAKYDRILVEVVAE